MGPLAQSDPSVHLLLVQVVLIVLAATGLGLAAAVEERGEAARRLAETTSLLRGVTEGTPDVVFVKDLDGRYLLINRRAPATGGVGGGDRTDRRVSSTPHPAADPDLRRLVLETGEVRTDEYAEVGRRRRTFLATKGPVRDAQGDIVGIFGISREITTRKLERMLLNGILEGTHDLVSAVDLDFRFVAFNQALKDEYRKGFGVDLVRGRSSPTSWPTTRGPGPAPPLLGRAFRGERRARPGHGTHTAEAMVDVLASPLRDETDHVIGGALIGRDITKAREAETALGEPVAIPRPEPAGSRGHLRDRPLRPLHLRERRLVRPDRPAEAEALGQAWNQGSTRTTSRGWCSPGTRRWSVADLPPAVPAPPRSGRELCVTGAAEPLATRAAPWSATWARRWT